MSQLFKSFRLLLWLGLFTVIMFPAAQAQTPLFPALPPAPPEVMYYHGVGMVAIRSLAEVVGANMRWDDQLKVAALTRGACYFSCMSNNRSALSNEEHIRLPLAPFDRVDVLYAPVRQCVLALGGQTTTDFKAKIVTLTMVNPRQIVQLPLTMQEGDTSAFTDFRDPELYLAELDSGLVRRLSYDTTADSFPRFSPNNDKVAYQYGDSLYLWDLTTHNGKILLQANGEKGEHCTLDEFSADGKSLGYYSDKGYWMITLASGVVRRAQPEPAQSNVLPLSSPRVLAKDDGIWITGADNTSKLLLAGAENTRPMLTPDRKHIIFNQLEPFFIMDLDGTNQRQLTPDKIFNTENMPCAFTPDGKNLLFFGFPEVEINKGKSL